MENEKQKSTDYNSLNQIKKHYIIKKDNDFEDLIKVKDSFSDPKEYLKKQKKMIIGHITSKFLKYKKSLHNIKSSSFSHSLYLSPINDTQKIEQSLKNNFYPKSKSLILNSDSKNKTKNKSKLIRNYSCKNNYNSKSLTYLNQLEHTNGKYVPKIHYKIKSMGNMLQIFNKYKNIEEKNKKRKTSFIFGNNKLPSETKKEIGKNLSGQEKALLHQEHCKNSSQIFSKNISKKIKRKESDLLFNKIEIYRLKKQLIDLVEKSRSLREKFGSNHWMVSLRRPKSSQEVRYLYSNICDKFALAPDKIIDPSDKDFEFISDPSLQNNKEYTEILKTINNLRIINNLNIPDAEKVLDIEIKGENVLNKEMADFKQIKNDKFKLFKDPKEYNHKNINNMTCKESFDVKYRIQKNRYYTNEESKNSKINENKILYRSKSSIGEFRIRKNKKKEKKETPMQKAYKLLMKDNKQRESSIKIISYK